MARLGAWRWGTVAAVGLLAGCGSAGGPGGATTPATTATAVPAAAAPTTATTAASTATVPSPKPRPAPHAVARPARRTAPGAVATRRRVPAPALALVTTASDAVRAPDGARVARVVHAAGGVTLLEFDGARVAVHLHSGTEDAGTSGWRYTGAVARSELPRLLAAFNGGFRLSTGAGGFLSYGRVAVPLQAGLASIVSYADGSTDVGRWRRGLPDPARTVRSVRQNLEPLVDDGHAAATVDCRTCWGATLGGVGDPARSAFGITADGRLVFAGGEHLTVAALAAALVGAGVARAAELDINPEWVNAYLYRHPGGGAAPVAVPVIAGQAGIPGDFLSPWSRDFFTVVLR